MGSRANPGDCQLHLLPLDQISETTGELEPNINRYLMRAVQLDICRGSSSLFTFAKLGRFILLGFIYEPNLSHWRGTRVHASHGHIEPRRYVLPRAFGVYLNEKARRMREALASMSDRQHDKVDGAFRANVERYAGSDAFHAMNADVQMFGSDAFSKPRPRPDEP